MDTLFFKPLVFGGFAALALVAVLVLRRQLDVFHCFVRRLSVPERVALVGFLAICIAYGGSKTNSPSMMMARPPARPTVTSDDIARGWQFVGAVRGDADEWQCLLYYACGCDIGNELVGAWSV